MPYKDPEKQRAAVALRRPRYKANQRAYRNKWKAAHPESKANYRNDPEKWAIHACQRIRYKMKKLGIKCDLCPEDIQIPAVCPFTLLPFVFSMKRGPNRQSPSVDRIKPNRGYTRGNVRVISMQANCAKSDITDPDVFQRLADDARIWSLV